MSTLEKVVNLLQDMPEQQIETIYTITQLINMHGMLNITIQAQPPVKENVETAFGIAHKYANPKLIQKEKGAFEDAMAKKHAVDRC